eukprot:1265154-Amphidinium_carterae.1
MAAAGLVMAVGMPTGEPLLHVKTSPCVDAFTEVMCSESGSAAEDLNSQVHQISSRSRNLEPLSNSHHSAVASLCQGPEYSPVRDSNLKAIEEGANGFEVLHGLFHPSHGVIHCRVVIAAGALLRGSAALRESPILEGIFFLLKTPIATPVALAIQFVTATASIENMDMKPKTDP